MAISILDDYPPGTRCGNTCSCCKASRRDLGYGRRERVVDLHEQIDWEGHLLICESCVREAAAMLGMIDPEMRDEAVAAMHEAQRSADELKSERDEAFQLVDLLRSHDEKAVPKVPAFQVVEPPGVGQLHHAPDPYEQAVKPARRPRAAAKNV